MKEGVSRCIAPLPLTPRIERSLRQVAKGVHERVGPMTARDKGGGAGLGVDQGEAAVLMA